MTRLLGGGPRWLIEGSADLVSFKVLDDYRLGNYQTTSLARIQVVRSSSTPLQNLESWTGMTSADGGTNAAYAIGFAASERLANTVGLSSLAAFWSGIGGGLTWQESFGRAFGRSISAFYTEFAQYRATNYTLLPRISGLVTNSTGAPFPNIHVYACPIPAGSCVHTVTNADGSYSIVVGDGTFRLQFGRSSDGQTPDGYYSAGGFTTDAGRATLITIRGAGVDGISVRMPF